MFGDKEVTISVDIIADPKGLLRDIDTLLCDAESLEAYQGILDARRLVAKTIQTEHVTQGISGTVLARESLSGQTMAWTIESMKRDLVKRLIEIFPVSSSVFSKEV